MDNYKKKYDEALERARKLKENPQSVFNEYSPKEGDTICDYIFPELKESEDEKIRKGIISGMKALQEKGKYTCFANIPMDDVFAWLEKQDPKKHEEELEKAYKTADEVQYKRGYEDAVKDTEKQGKQAPAWSEEDEKILKDILVDVKFEGYNNDMLANSYKKINWLKSLKQRIKKEAV